MKDCNPLKERRYKMATADTLEELREKIPSSMVRMDRHPKDDPCIVEVWI
jgi:hypothetical protein